MNTLTVHTSAQAQYTGTLLQNAQARTAVPGGDSHALPVLCLDLELDNTVHTRMHVEQPFPAGHHAQATAAAQRLKKGMRITVMAPLEDLRLLASNTTHIHVHPEAQAH